MKCIAKQVLVVGAWGCGDGEESPDLGGLHSLYSLVDGLLVRRSEPGQE